MDTMRFKNALWGAFIADSMAMPAHWYYKRKYIKEGFNGAIEGYNDAPHPHPESFMVGNSYRPNIQKAKELGRPFDIAHEHIRFYDTNYNDLDIKLAVHAGEHKNAMPDKDERYHYHHGLKAGDNTLGAHLLRVLMRSVNKTKEYSQVDFIEEFVKHMTTPGLNKDPYTEVYVRAWFKNFTEGVPPHACAQEQRNVWSIGSSGGAIRPLLLSLTSDSAYQALGVALQHQQITHRSDNVSSALTYLVPLLHELLEKKDPMSTIKEHVKNVQLIKIKGSVLSKTYAVLSYLLYKNKFDFRASILANANAGGDNVHRGILLGMLAGAASDEIPHDLKEGLRDYESIKSEIDKFVETIQKKEI